MLDSHEALEAAVQQAEGLWRQGDLAAALDHYSNILRERLAARLPFMGADAIISERLGDLALVLGHAQAADALFASLIQLYQGAGNLREADYSSLKRVEMALEQGRLREAQQLLTQMAPTIGDVRAIRFTRAGLDQWEGTCQWPNTDRAGRVVLFSRLYLVMGRLLAALGQYSQALSALERGLSYTGTSAPPLARQARLAMQLAIAGALLEKGELRAADKRLAEIEPDLDPLRQPGRSTRWLELRGKLHLLRGEFGSALERFRQVRGLCIERNFVRAALRATLNLAHLQILLNQTSLATQLLTDAKVRAAALNDSSLEIRIDLLLHLAHARSHSLADSAPSVSAMWGMDARTIERNEGREDGKTPLDIGQAENYLTFFEDRTLAFHWLIGRLDFDRAADFLTQMEKVFGVSDSALIKTRLRILQGILAYYQGEFERSAAILDGLRSDLRAWELIPELWQTQRFLGWCWTWLSRSTEERDALNTQTDELLAKMTGTLSAAEQAIYLLNKWTADEEAIALEIVQLRQMKAELESLPWFRRPRRRWALMRHLNALMQRVDGYKAALAKRTVTGDEAGSSAGAVLPLWRRLLLRPVRRATVSFLVLPDQVLVVRSGWLTLDFHVSPVTRIQVRELVQGWHTLVQRWHDTSGQESGDIVSESQNAANLLAERLQFPALLERIPWYVRSITIIPDDGLHGFPFAAIRTGRGYLIERYALSIGFERNDLQHSVPDAQTPEALIVGVVNGNRSFAPLPETRSELELVALRTPHHTSRKLTDHAANKAAVIGNLPHAGFVHIACHGVFKPDQPDQSGIVLIPRPDQAEEVLSLRELSTLTLAGLQHITLSSCWSADHYILPGRWIISLPETLWRAGAHSILGCMWKVDDRLAVALMMRFYDHLEKLPRDRALQQAQLECLANRLPGLEGTDTSNPFYWAGYNLYGNSSALKL